MSLPLHLDEKCPMHRHSAWPPKSDPFGVFLVETFESVSIFEMPAIGLPSLVLRHLSSRPPATGLLFLVGPILDTHPAVTVPTSFGL